MPQIVVSISDMKISNSPADVLATFSLGSCIGVSAYDPRTRIGGLIHCLLPSTRNSRRDSRDNPYMFVNTGVSAMIRTLLRKGAARNRLILKAAGGANMRGDQTFLTGERNAEALRRLLARNNMALDAEELGGTIPRTMYLRLSDGQVTVKTFGKVREL